MPTDRQHPFPNSPRSEPDEQIRLPSLPNRLNIIERIMSEAIHDPIVSPYRPRAQFTFFCGFEPSQRNGYQAQLVGVGRCLEWFVFDYIIPELNVTPAQHWVNTHAQRLEPDQLLIAKNCLNFILGIYEIHNNVPGLHFEAIDLLRQRQLYFVNESVVSKEIQNGQLLLARLFPYQGEYVLSGMATIMTAHATSDFKHLLAEQRILPAHILPFLDGVELENLFGRTLSDIDRIEDLPLLHEKLKHYLEIVSPARLSFIKLLDRINKTPDPFNVAAFLCDTLHVTCRHEMDLLLAYIMAAWFQSHKP